MAETAKNKTSVSQSHSEGVADFLEGGVDIPQLTEATDL